MKLLAWEQTQSAAAICSPNSHISGLARRLWNCYPASTATYIEATLLAGYNVWNCMKMSINFVEGLNLTVIYFNNSIRVTSPVFLINTIDQTSFEEFCSRCNVVTTIKEWSFYLCLHIFCCHYVVHSKTLWIHVTKCPKNTFEGISSILNVSKTTRKNKWEVVASNSQDVRNS